MTALHALAATLRGHVIPTDDGGRIVTPDGGVIYCNFLGAIKVQRYGHVVATLGTITDSTEDIAAAYHELTAVSA